MLLLLHWLFLITLTLALPVELAYLIARKRPRQRVTRRLAAPVISGLLGGFALNYLHATAFGGRVLFWQIVVAAFWITGLLICLRALDRWLIGALFRLVRVPRLRPTPEPFWPGLRRSFALGFRVLPLFILIIPLVFVSALLYRPATKSTSDLSTDLSIEVTRVDVRAGDRTKLAGWWMPASTPRGQTAIVCSGGSVTDPLLLPLYRELTDNGYGVLALNLRTQTGSGGRLTSFGAAEKLDLLGAVAWLREHQPKEARRIVGFGKGTGAVALLNAAVDDSDEGRAIESVVLFGAFEDFTTLPKSFLSRSTFASFGHLLTKVGVGVASIVVGHDLFDLSPVHTVDRLWPRPVLFMNDARDGEQTASSATALFDAACQPKYFYWLPAAEESPARDSTVVAKVIRTFFDVARAVI